MLTLKNRIEYGEMKVECFEEEDVISDYFIKALQVTQYRNFRTNTMDVKYLLIKKSRLTCRGVLDKLKSCNLPQHMILCYRYYLHSGFPCLYKSTRYWRAVDQYNHSSIGFRVLLYLKQWQVVCKCIIFGSSWSIIYF